mmetsp:Transcript_98507/g.234540  ORF Transcript_98507/g.234540 Transcript_98507/m.234540 type:complete len:214 (-) Transcript_98507:3198-3839(-)
MVCRSLELPPAQLFQTLLQLAVANLTVAVEAIDGIKGFGQIHPLVLQHQHQVDDFRRYLGAVRPPIDFGLWHADLREVVSLAELPAELVVSLQRGANIRALEGSSLRYSVQHLPASWNSHLERIHGPIRQYVHGVADVASILPSRNCQQGGDANPFIVEAEVQLKLLKLYLDVWECPGKTDAPPEGQKVSEVESPGVEFGVLRVQDAVEEADA